MPRRILTILVPLMMVGCNSIWNGWLDPSQVGRFRHSAKTMELRRSVSVADEPPFALEADDPTPEDTEVRAKDYVLQPSDLISLSIFELIVPGQPWVQSRQISREGYITLPQVSKDIYVADKTARQLEKYLEKLLEEEQILNEAMVTVMVIQARGSNYSILGGVGGPGVLTIPRPDFRLMDALAVAGGIPNHPMIRTIYVLRDGGQQRETESEQQSEVASPATFTSVGPSSQGGQSGHWVWVDGEWKFIEKQVTTTTASAPAPVTPPPAPTTQASRPAAPEGETTWEELASELPARRIIAIPIDKLKQADMRYNVVIRDRDIIWVPPPHLGEFYIMGNVPRPGVFSLAGREVTLRQAISAAGGLGGLADPMRCELIRRIGDQQEQIVHIDLDRIFSGKDEDIILKPNDIINVGTNPLMPFLAIIRHAFRMTYGFGFIYDRNFADIDSYGPQDNPTDRRRSERRTRFGF